MGAGVCKDRLGLGLWYQDIIKGQEVGRERERERKRGKRTITSIWNICHSCHLLAFAHNHIGQGNKTLPPVIRYILRVLCVAAVAGFHYCFILFQQHTAVAAGIVACNSDYCFFVVATAEPLHFCCFCISWVLLLQPAAMVTYIGAHNSGWLEYGWVQQPYNNK